jgi:hypothetical protein
VYVDVELAFFFVDAEACSVKADDVANAVGDGEILEALGKNNDGSEVVVSSFGTLLMERGVNDFERANIPVLAYFVGESSIDNNTVDAVSLGGGKGDLSKFGVLVLLGLVGLGNLGWGC